MTIRHARRYLAGALLAATGVSLLAAPAGAVVDSSNATSATTAQIAVASSPTKKFVGQGENSGVNATSSFSSSSAKWTFVRSSTFAGHGVYFIKQTDPLGSGQDLYLDLSGNSTASGVPLVTAKGDHTISQLWILEQAFSGQYQFKNRLSKKYITFNSSGGSAPLRMQPAGVSGEIRFNSVPGLT